jgi:hypothetical protein
MLDESFFEKRPLPSTEFTALETTAASNCPNNRMRLPKDGDISEILTTRRQTPKLFFANFLFSPVPEWTLLHVSIQL